MSYDCYCDYDPPEFCTISRPKARKQHKCYECGGAILPGEQYEYTVGKWEGDLDTFKICERCRDIRQWVKNNVPCLCWAYGSIIDDCREAVIEAQCRAPEETKGLWFGFLRRVVTRDKFNKQRRIAA